MSRPGCALAVLLLLTGSAAAQLVDGVAAIVDRDVILLSEVEFAARLVTERLLRTGNEVPEELRHEIRKDALETLIESKLIERFAERVNLAAGPQDIDLAVETIAEDEGVTPEAVYAAATQQGMSREVYRRELGRQITRMKVISGTVRSRIAVLDEELQELYDQRYVSQPPGLRARTRHLLLAWPPEVTPEIRTRIKEFAERLREQAIENGDFIQLVRQYSRAPSAAEGGLTTFRKGDAAAEIEDLVFTLPPGEITPVIETEHGLNLFQILDRYNPSEVAFADVEASLRAEIVERKTGPEFDEWIGELRENRYIEVVAPGLK